MSINADALHQLTGKGVYRESRKFFKDVSRLSPLKGGDRKEKL
jgi:hypothetical protein